MKCKIFKGDDLAKVEKQVNDWMKAQKVVVTHSSTAIQIVKVPMTRETTGKPPKKILVPHTVVVITAFYG